tara:strand:- start:509 stop:1075 length:567 start_codon:yes stop_codon:yes gene_type:complete
MSSLKLNETPDNLDIIRNGDRFAVTIGPILRSERWKGGTWVKYVADHSNTDSFTVERSDGVYSCGFVIYGSEDYTNARQSTYRNFTSYQNTSVMANALGTATLTLVAGGGRFLFKDFEQFNLDGNGDRTVPATYQLNEELKVSENGLLCNDGDVRLLAKTGGAKTLIVGICCLVPTEQVPKLGLDYKF